MCCASCATYPVKSLLDAGDTVRGFWFNPNIQPIDEFHKRMGTLKQFQSLWGLQIDYVQEHETDTYTQAVSEHDGIRCEACYDLRLRRTAQHAKEIGYDKFTTSLLISPFQHHEKVQSAGLAAAAQYGVEFIYEDFREGWKHSRELSEKFELYRQKYCGCLNSLDERETARQERIAAKQAAKAAKAK
jgi:predicted adenine nucleotide alpha hydrolase (AANH) superfamily ATPase